MARLRNVITRRMAILALPKSSRRAITISEKMCYER